MKKVALVTGITGMDGSHLVDFLLQKDYIVYGMERRSSSRNRNNIKHLENNSNVIILKGDLTDQSSLLRVIKESNPAEIYNLGSQSFVGESWNTPEFTSNVTGLGVLRMLEAIREYGKSIKFYQAGSSEMFGNTTNIHFSPEDLETIPALEEGHPFNPRSPYGVAKLFGHHITKNYRESYGMFACSGILFNHESERRGIEFVTRKISNGVARIKFGIDDHIALGNLEARRDWGYAPDYVEAMWLMLQEKEPKDYVIATGISHSIKDFISEAFFIANIDNWKSYIKIESKYMRPAEVHILCGNATKAFKELGWKPKTTFKELVSKMVINDIKLLENENAI